MYSGHSGRSVTGMATRSPGSRRAQKRAARFRALLLLAALVGGGWYLWRQSPLPALPPGLATVRVGAVEEAVEAEGLVIRQEQVVVAPVSGQVRRLVADGERVRVGAPVVEITPGASAAPGASQTAGSGAPAGQSGSAAAQKEYDRLSGEIYRVAAALNSARDSGETAKAARLEAELNDLARRQADLLEQMQPTTGAQAAAAPAVAAGGQRVASPVSGVLLYQADGLEGVLTLEAVGQSTPAWVRGLPEADPRPAGEGAVAAGQPLFKVIDDQELNLVMLVDSRRITAGQRTQMAQQGVRLRIAGKERTVTAHLRRAVEEGEMLLLHLSVPLPSSDAMRVRRLRTTLLLERHEGTIVPRSAIDVVDGRTGIWLWAGGKAEFRPVTVVGGNPAEVAVKGEIPPDAQVLREVPPGHR